MSLKFNKFVQSRSEKKISNKNENIVNTCGIPAAPMLAAVAVMEIAKSCPMLGFMLFTWAMKMAAMAS